MGACWVWGTSGISEGVIQCGVGHFKQELQTQVVVGDMDVDEIVQSEVQAEEREKGCGF